MYLNISSNLNKFGASKSLNAEATCRKINYRSIASRNWSRTVAPASSTIALGLFGLLSLGFACSTQAAQLPQPPANNSVIENPSANGNQPPLRPSLGPAQLFTAPSRSEFKSPSSDGQLKSRPQTDLHRIDSSVSQQVPVPAELQSSETRQTPQRLNPDQSNSALQMLQNSNASSLQSTPQPPTISGLPGTESLPGNSQPESRSSANAAASLINPEQPKVDQFDPETIQKASYLGQELTDGMRFGVPNPDKPTNLLGLEGGSNASSIDSTYAQTPAQDLHPIEKKYSQWWRDSLTSAEVEGEFLEVYQIVSGVPHDAKPAILAAYWDIAEAIVRWKIYQDNKQWWQEATQQNRNQYALSIANAIDAEADLAEANIRTAQAHFSRLAQAYGFPQKIRPADAPFTGKYDTKIKEFQGGLPEQWNWMASEVDDKWQLILNDDTAVQWASAQWQNSQRSGSIEQMAAAFQLQQRSMLVLTGHVAQYNQSIAKYALQVGYQKNATQQVAMLLRNPVIGGQLMDIAADPIFKNQNAIAGSYLVPGNISQVAYYDEYGQPIDATALSYDSADGMMVQAFPPSMNAAQISNSQYAASAQYSANTRHVAAQNLGPQYNPSNQSLNGSTGRNLEYRPTTQRAMPSDPQAWQAAQNAANIRR